MLREIRSPEYGASSPLTMPLTMWRKSLCHKKERGVSSTTIVRAGKLAPFATVASLCQVKSIPAQRGLRLSCYAEPADQNRSFAYARQVRDWARGFPART